MVVGILNMDTFALGAIGFLLWAVSPYLFAVFMTKRSTQYAATLVVTGVSSILAISGIFLLIDAMYIHLDAQSALVFVVIPMYQWIILLVTVRLYYKEKIIYSVNVLKYSYILSLYRYNISRLKNSQNKKGIKDEKINGFISFGSSSCCIEWLWWWK